MTCEGGRNKMENGRPGTRLESNTRRDLCTPTRLRLLLAARCQRIPNPRSNSTTGKLTLQASHLSIPSPTTLASESSARAHSPHTRHLPWYRLLSGPDTLSRSVTRTLHPAQTRRPPRPAGGRWRVANSDGAVERAVGVGAGGDGERRIGGTKLEREVEVRSGERARFCFGGERDRGAHCGGRG